MHFTVGSLKCDQQIERNVVNGTPNLCRAVAFRERKAAGVSEAVIRTVGERDEML